MTAPIIYISESPNF